MQELKQPKEAIMEEDMTNWYNNNINNLLNNKYNIENFQDHSKEACIMVKYKIDDTPKFVALYNPSQSYSTGNVIEILYNPRNTNDIVEYKSNTYHNTILFFLLLLGIIIILFNYFYNKNLYK